MYDTDTVILTVVMSRFLSKEAATVCEVFRYGSTLSEGGPCLGWRNTQLVPYHWLTYNEVSN